MPKIYVACLASYNAGVLHGAWIDVCDEDQVNEEIQAMLKLSKEPLAEEFAIHDTDDFEGIRIEEYTPISDVVEIANAIDEHGDAFVAAYKYNDSFEDALSAMEHYEGEYSSKEDFAWNWLEMMEIVTDDTNPMIVAHLDAEGVAQDLLSSDYYEVDGHYFMHH